MSEHEVQEGIEFTRPSLDDIYIPATPYAWCCGRCSAYVIDTWTRANWHNTWEA